jgi:hypothetical protein
MLSRPTACRLAVQRGIRATSEAVWITDDVLSKALQRFCLIRRSSKRDASSVPGPMESRRRIGKRRIANLSEAVQTPGQDFGALWGMGGALERQQWQWEAPSRRQLLPATGGTPHLPAWLGEYQLVTVDDLPETFRPEGSILADRGGPSTSIEDKLRTFGESLKASSTDRLQTLCDSFNHSFRQNLVLGLVSDDIIYTSLQYVTEAIREVTTDKLLAASRCQSFYTTAWNGITACKVLRPVDLGSNLLDKFLVLLGELPSTATVQTLAIDVMQAVSRDQIARMEDGISTIVRAWLSSWTSLEIDNGRDGMDAIILHELHYAMPITQPLKESVRTLAKFLSQLPRTMVRNTLYASTNHLVSTSFANFKGSLRTIRTLRYSWVSVVANMPPASENLLIGVWSRMDFSDVSSENSGDYTPNIPRLSLHESCNLLLDFWISHGQIKAAESVRATFMASVKKSGRLDSAGHLLQAVDQYHEHWRNKAECLFRFLRRLGKPQAVYHTFRNLLAQNLNPPASLVAREIQEMSFIDPRCALNIYKLYRRVQKDRTPLLLDWCPELVISMIRSPDFDTAEIWGALGVPLSNPYRKKLPCKPLHPARIRLVHRMALAFARADCRSPRLALRNVMHCMLYLHRHGVPVSADLSRALTNAGITRSLLNERWVGREKAAWILDIVQKVEGGEVSANMEQILQHLLTERIAKQRRLQREANPLRVGPID